MLVSQIQAWSKDSIDSHLHNQSIRRRGEHGESRSLPERASFSRRHQSVWRGGRDKCVCEEKTQRELFPPFAPPANQFHTLSPPRHSDVIHSRARGHGNATAYNCTFLYICHSPLPTAPFFAPKPDETSPFICRVQLTPPSLTSTHPLSLLPAVSAQSSCRQIKRTDK